MAGGLRGNLGRMVTGECVTLFEAVDLSIERSRELVVGYVRSMN